MPLQDYSTIGIIYNPNSTSGRAKILAVRLEKHLKKHTPRVKLYATEFAGHAEDIAYDIACSENHPLIISVSGDGGYNEVINGTMRAVAEKKAGRPVCAIEAAGNANDHSRTVKKQPLMQAILHDNPEPIDILLLTTHGVKNPIKRYAHSYIGFGISSHVASELNRRKLNRINELAIVVQGIFRFKPFIIINAKGKKNKLDSLVFANIHQMAKVFRVGEKTNLHDGMFRVASFPYSSNPLRRFYTLASVAITGMKNPPQQHAFEFTLPQTELAHFDGEVMKIPGGSKVKVTAVKEALLTLR